MDKWDYLGRNAAAICAAGTGVSVTEIAIAAGFGLSVAACKSDPKCSSLLEFVERPGMWLMVATSVAVCKCKDLIMEQAVPRKCTKIAGQTWETALVSFCWYRCADGTEWMGEAVTNTADCPETIDHPDDD